jgi:predicted O-methyltransferase YrrM
MVGMKSKGVFIVLFILTTIPNPLLSQEPRSENDLDRRVESFLENHRDDWYDLNVPASDGKLLYDLILKNGYTRALEIGTSTGHSTIWMAWALSKTGGTIITVEIDRRRHDEALRHFEEAGLASIIDARLGDAHRIVPELEGSFDFVFCDADKGWYKQYLIDVLPKLETGGCFTAHNVAGRLQYGIRPFLDHLYSLPGLETTIDRTSSAGLSISYKREPE